MQLPVLVADQGAFGVYVIELWQSLVTASYSLLPQII